MLNEKLLVAPSPHLRSGASTQDIMRDVLIALLPAVAASVILFGLRALVLECICVAACMLAEYITRRILHRDNTIMDLSAAVTGLILALNLPVTINPLFAVIGCIVAIVIVKQLFGGLGQNFVNPAATARVVLLVSFPAAMSRWVAPFYYKTSSAVDAVTTATPLTQLAKGEEVKAKDMLRRMYEYYYNNPEAIPADFQPQMSFDGMERTICDYIAGMTDNYAVDKFTELFPPTGWHIRG